MTNTLEPRACASADDAIARELSHIRIRRNLVFPGRPQVQGEEAASHIAKPLGLAFSGGGIRSATFNLGLVQGLAESGLLKYVDYLSTVSGGGYLGSWLHGLVRNVYDGDPARAERMLSPTLNPRPGPPKDDAVSFLRKFSNYLAPRPGLLSADSWVIGFIWLRNVLLNQLILVPALGVAIVFALLLVQFQQQVSADEWKFASGGIAAALSGAALILAAIVIERNLSTVVKQTFQAPALSAAKSEHEVKWERRSMWVVPCVFLASALLGSVDIGAVGAWIWGAVGLVLAALFLLFQVFGGFLLCYRRLHAGRWATARGLAHVFWMVVVTTAVTTGLIFAVSHTSGSWQSWNRLAFGPALVCLSLLAGGALLVGLMGADYPDAAREWIARIGSLMALAAAGWVALFVVSVQAPKWFAQLLGEYGAVGLTAIASWVATTIAGVQVGGSARAVGDDQPTTSRIVTWVTKLAPAVFMVGYLLLLSYGVHAAVASLAPPGTRAAILVPPVPSRVTIGVRIPESAPPIEVDVRGPEGPSWLQQTFAPVAAFAAGYDAVLKADPARTQVLLLLLLGCVIVATVASQRININEFSMHHFYKNRLVRCYLGASNSRRRAPNPLTGFDPADDFPISQLLPTSTGGYRGPYAIVNVTLNLNAGSELAKQERKGASFVFTPEYCGFAPSHSHEDNYMVRQTHDLEPHGYRPTKGYSSPQGPALGTTMAISGAAASPNSGYSTSGPMAFLLTVFDARLGWWLGNPRWADPSRQPGPSFALRYLFAELFAQTTSRSRFVNLSDGGHFDNLGLYELVRRRCRYIIIGDAEQDQNLTFGSLGAAIRKCRADFGVEIDIDPNPIRLGTNRFSKAHCVVGTISYPEAETGVPVSLSGDPARPSDNRARGWILYLKSSLTGDEPADVIEYKTQFADFPHQSTADQFFSESQFESYRRLGLHVLRDAFEGVNLQLVTGAQAELVAAFQELTRKWYAPVPLSDEGASRLNDAYSQLMRLLGEKTELAGLVPELLAGVSDAALATTPTLTPVEQMFLVELLQLMENVYTEFRLEHRANRANPRNAGWIQVFRRWARSPALYNVVWKQMQGDYNPLFGHFMNEHLRRAEVEDVPMRS